LDTAGQEEYAALRDGYMRSANAFLCLYSITEKKSLSQLSEFVKQIHRVKDADYWPMVLVGNKCDLESERSVSFSDAVQFAKNVMGIDETQVIEASAKKRKNIDESFSTLVRSTRTFFAKNEKLNENKKKKACLLL